MKTTIAKSSSTSIHPKVDLPDLPEEIWLDVFRIACGVSDLDNSPKLLSLPLSLPIKALLKALRRRMKQQRNIIHVCKMWYRIARPYLYEEIVIFDQNGLKKLAELFGRSQISLGMHTKRLDVFNLAGITKSDMETFTAIFSQMPNLQVLSFSSQVDETGSIPIPLLQQAAALPSLRVLYISPMHWWNTEDERFPMISSSITTTLRVATFHIFQVMPNYPTLPNLSQICMSSRTIVPEGWLLKVATDIPGGFASVTSLLIGQRSIWIPFTIWALFCDSIPRLEYIGLQTTFDRFELPDREDDFPMAFPRTVHTLGITFQSQKAKYGAYREVCNRLSEMRAEGLRKIRFGERTVADIRSKPSVSAMMEELFRMKGWVMEAGDMYV